ncbi:MAG: P-II family nitrogen regulator [Coriobacteriales bacterium]|jgi:nitrogen regulatory protein P-II 1|nr:P-II family nitrogen regulator [Coriobacteriales bacterium]
MKKIEAIVRPSKLEPLKEALLKFGIKGLTVSEVHGCGNQLGWKEYFRGSEVIVNMRPKVKFEIITADESVEELTKVIINTAKTGEVGDGKIFVYPVEEVIRIRTEESGEVAI